MLQVQVKWTHITGNDYLVCITKSVSACSYIWYIALLLALNPSWSLKSGPSHASHVAIQYVAKKTLWDSSEVLATFHESLVMEVRFMSGHMSIQIRFVNNFTNSSWNCLHASQYFTKSCIQITPIYLAHCMAVISVAIKFSLVSIYWGGCKWPLTGLTKC